MTKSLSTALFILLLMPAIRAQQWYFTPSLHGRDVNAIKIFGRDTILVTGGWIFPDSTRSIFKTFNGTLLWNVYADTNAHWIKSMDFINPETGFAVGAGSTILKTDDAGESWTRLNAPILRDFNKIILIDSLNYVIAGGFLADSVHTATQTILKSADGGQTWNVMLDQSGQRLNAVYFPDSLTGYAVGDSGTILKTANGGNNWTVVSSPVQRDFNAVWFSDSNNGIIAGGKFSNDSIQTILRTTNGGNNWSLIYDTLGGWLTDVYFLDADTGYIAGDRATLLKTIDGGQSWVPQTINGAVGDEHFNTVRFLSWDYGVIAGKRGYAYTYTQARKPEADVTGADLMDSTHAVIHGVINTFGQAANFTVIYTPDPTFLDYFVEFPADVRFNGPGPVQFPLSDLIPDTTYYCLLKAYTIAGNTFSDTLSFFTGIPESEIKTLEASNVTATAAKLNGSVKGFSGTVNLFFQFGTTPAFGNQVMASPSSVSDTSFHAVDVNVSFLQPNSLYYFRLKGVRGTDIFYGDVHAFFTGDVYDTFQAISPYDVTDTSAILNGKAGGFKVPAVVNFEFSTDNSVFYSLGAYSTFVIGDSLTHLLSQPTFLINPEAIYYYRLKATTVLGTYYSDTFFFSNGGSDFHAQTLEATSVMETSATLNGAVQQLPQQANLIFEYGITPALGSEIVASPGVVNDTLFHAVSAALTGLQKNTLYYYRVAAEMSNGSRYVGEKKQIFTGTPSIPNWDFQQWDNSNIDLPEQWLVIADNFNRVPGHSGNYALEIFRQNLVILGSLKNGLHAGAPINARPDSVAAWFKYDFPDNDSMAGMLVTLRNQGDTIAEQYCFVTGNSGGEFKRHAFKIDYQSPLTPDTIGITIFLSRPTGSLIVDDLHLIAAAATIPNAGFENWFPYGQQSLESWVYTKFLVSDSLPGSDIKVVTQTTFNDPGDYAADIHNVDLSGNGVYMPGNISTTYGFLGSPPPSFPVYARHLSLNGYFKYFPVNGDSMTINIMMSKGGQPVGSGQFIYGDSVGQFEPFTIPISYVDGTVVPDSAIIAISAAKGDMANGPSHVIVDKLSFDGFYVATGISTVIEAQSFLQKIYPNPVRDILSVQLTSGNPLTAKMFIMDLTGKTVYAGTSFIEGGNVPVTVQVPLKNFGNGFYFLVIQSENKIDLAKFIIIK